jgi:carbamoyl-phosphate synthase large subunit
MIPALVARLRQSPLGYRLIGLDADPAITDRRDLGFDDLHAIPSGTAPDYVDRLIAVCAAYAPALLVAGSDEEAAAVAVARDRLARHGIVANVSPSEMLQRFTDKHVFGEELQKAGFGSGPQQRVDSVAAALAAANACGYPERDVILKPVHGRGRRGVRILTRRNLSGHPDLAAPIAEAELDAYFSVARHDTLVMPFYDGDALTIDILADRGELVQHVCRRWLAGWRFPFPGQEILIEPRYEALARQMARLFGLHGLVDVDAILTPDGEVAPLEINPRPSGSVAVALAAGVPLYDQLFELLINGVRPLPVATQARVIDGGALEHNRVATP